MYPGFQTGCRALKATR